MPPTESLPPLRESWQPVAMPAAVSAPRSNRLGLIALVVAIALALVLGAGALHLGSDSLPPGTSAFVAGKGVVFTSPDGVYRARFPQAATMETVPPTSNGLTLDRASAKTDAYEIVAVSSVAAAPVPPASVNVLLEAGLAAEIANLNGKLQSKHDTTFAGMPAIEGSFKGSDGYAARILIVASGANVFEVVVHAKSGTDKLFKAFEASLTIY